MLQAERSRVRDPIIFYFNLPNPSGRNMLWGSLRNEYQKQKNNVSGEYNAAGA
jgi:hypothetical protein